MKVFNTKLSDIQADNYYRLDEKFYIFFTSNRWKLFKYSQNCIKLKYLLAQNNKNFIYAEDEEYFGVPTGASYINKNGQIINYDIVTKEEHPGRIKYKITNDDIVISSLRLARSPATIFNDIDTDRFIFSNGFYILKTKINWNNRFLMYILRLPQLKKIIDSNIYRGIGISAYKIDDLYKLEIPFVTLEKQKEFLNIIRTNEKSITELYKKQRNVNDIINEVFSDEFYFDKNLINEVRKGMTYGTQSSTNNKLSIFYNNIGKLNGNKIRLSVRANSPIIHEIYKVLNKYGTINLKDVIYENIHRGKSPDYDKNGSIPVIKTAHITNNGISNEYEEFVNEDFYNKKIDAQVKKGDILLASTGKHSIGKIDIFEDDYQAIPDGHISIIRINPEKYNRKFFVYYIRSVLGYTQIEKDYVGCTNQIELYREEIGKILLPDITLKKQEEIVEKIDEKIKEQNEIEDQIIEEQEKIEKILLEIIK